MAHQTDLAGHIPKNKVVLVHSCARLSIYCLEHQLSGL